jgi:hypothetical protein
MSEPSVVIHKEHLLRLRPFCHGLYELLERSGLPPENIRQTFFGSVSAECVGCGIHVSGEELFAISQPPSAETATIKIGRLRKGDCARQGCDSYYYTVSFQPQPPLDWSKLIAEAESGELTAPGKLRDELAHSTSKIRAGLRAPRQVFIALAVILVVLLFRQLYYGGRIPLIREPEHFRVDPGPEEHGSVP